MQSKKQNGTTEPENISSASNNAVTDISEDIEKEVLTNYFNVAGHSNSCSLDYIISTATTVILAVFYKYYDQLKGIPLGEYMFRLTSKIVSTHNLDRAKWDKFRYTRLMPVQIAYLINFLYPVRRIPCAGEQGDVDLDLLAIYRTEGSKAGLYDTSDDVFKNCVQQLKPGASLKEVAETKHIVHSIAQREEQCRDRDLIAVNNGIFDYQKKELMKFDPRYVFLRKCCVNYNPDAQNPMILNPDGSIWNIVDWIKELAADPDVEKLFWEVLGAVIRPHVSWNKCVFLYGPEGANGKGTFCELLRNLCGAGAASIPLSDFGKNFMLEPLIGAVADIADENNVGAYLDKAANFKAAVTGDIILINRKNRPAVPYRFTGLIIQCLNDAIRVQDISESFYRRCLFINFETSYTGRENKHIRDEYMHRTDVLEYVLYRVLNMNCYHFSEPAACKNALAEYKVSNDVVLQWWQETAELWQWNLLPWQFLYECFKHWFENNNRSGRVPSRRAFIDRMRKIAKDDTIWEYPGKGPDGKDKQIPAVNRIVGSEPLAKDYYLPDTDLRDPNKALRILGRAENWQGNHRGLLRRVPRLLVQSQVPSAQNPANSNPYGNSPAESYYDAVSAAK